MLALYDLVGGVSGAVRMATAAFICGSLAYGIGHNAGYRNAQADDRAAAVAASVEILRERNTTDGEVRDMDTAALCDALGGVLQPDGKCV